MEASAVNPGSGEFSERSPNTIQILPSEVLEKIFKFLTQTQKLISRLACKDWNDVILSVLPKTSQFVLESKVANEIILDSTVEWTNLRISDNAAFVLPTQFKNWITTLHLLFSNDTKMAWKKTLIGFPNLIALDLRTCGQKPISVENEDPSVQEKFLEIVRKLKSLTIRSPDESYTSLNGFLKEFDTAGSGLTKLCIGEFSCGKGKIPLSNSKEIESVLEHIYGIIFSSSSTLTYLSLNFRSEKILNELMPCLVTRLCSLHSLKLQTVVIEHEILPEHIDRDFEILYEFLKKQVNSSGCTLKTVCLPWCLDPVLCQEVISCLPRHIETIGTVKREHIPVEFPWSEFKKLKGLVIEGDITVNMSMEQCDSVRRLAVVFTKYNPGLEADGTYFTSKMFSNLTALWIDCNYKTPFSKNYLQIIITNLKKLRNLYIQSNDIADRGVIGFDSDDPVIQELVSTKRLYTNGSFAPEYNQLVLNPLSSLKELENLSLIGLGTGLTDVGIVLGFKFGSQLKQLNIGSSSPEISDLGLYCLGANNSGLENFVGSFKSLNISKLGIQDMRKQLPLVESTGKFKLLNEFSIEK